MSLSRDDHGALGALGWSSFFQLQIDASTERLEPGRIALAGSGRYRVLTADGPKDAAAAGRMLFDAGERADLPAVGDWVGLERVAHEGSTMRRIEHLFERRTRFARKAAGRRTEAQVVAANVDWALVLCAVGSDFNVRRVERYLTAVAESGASPVVALGKADLCDDPSPWVAELRAIAPVAPIVVVSSVRGDGLDDVRGLVRRGETLALLGSSGVGKSALLNCLLGATRQPVGAVREHDGRGRHTTTHRELFAMPGGGLVIDTPGMRELAPWACDETTTAVFPDVEVFAAECRFSDCGHDGEPGCRIAQALDAGELSYERLASWAKLERELDRQRLLQDGRARQSAKQRRKQLAKTARARARAKGS